MEAAAVQWRGTVQWHGNPMALPCQCRGHADAIAPHGIAMAMPLQLLDARLPDNNSFEFV